MKIHIVDIIKHFKKTPDLFSEEQEDPLKHLVAIESCDCHIEEESIQHGAGDVG